MNMVYLYECVRIYTHYILHVDLISLSECRKKPGGASPRTRVDPHPGTSSNENGGVNQ